MQPRAEEIQRVLTTFAEGKSAGGGDGSRRRPFALVVQGSTPLQATIRELRGSCAMIDIGSSIFTLAYSDILGIDPVPAEEGNLRVTVRPGCFASHVAARLRRTSARSWRGAGEAPGRAAAQPRASDREAERAAPGTFDESALLEELFESEGGTAAGGPAGSESARQEVVGEDAIRGRRS